jgi:hypothetical protein
MKNLSNNILLFGLPIELEHGLGTIRQPILKDFNSFDLNRFLRVFNIDKLFPQKEFENFKALDKIILFSSITKDGVGKGLYNDFFKSLSMLYETEDIKLVIDNTKENFDQYVIIIDGIHKIDRHNFGYLCGIVQQITGSEVQTNEQGEMTELEKKIAQRKREFELAHPKKEEDNYNIYDLANYIIHTDGTTFTYQNIQELTIYQLKNTFQMYSLKESYNTFMQYKTSGSFEIDEERKHWFFNKK